MAGELVRLIRAGGSSVTLADSPGGGTRDTKKNLERVYSAAGYSDFEKDYGCVLNYDCGYRDKVFPGGKVCTRFPLISPYFSADYVVSVSKAKTHVLTLLTGATKNTFGLLPGIEKPIFHSRFPDPDIFGEMLIDLLLCAPPALHVVDAIVAMEGDGPSAGSPRKIGAPSSPAGMHLQPTLSSAGSWPLTQARSPTWPVPPPGGSSPSMATVFPCWETLLTISGRAISKNRARMPGGSLGSRSLLFSASSITSVGFTTFVPTWMPPGVWDAGGVPWHAPSMQ